MFKKLFKNLLTKKQLKLVKDHPSNSFINVSFSQEGEDLLLARLLKNKANGFYVDIGAHHPFRFSNTYKFYQMGWKGINVDPFPGSMLLFEKYRPLDINLEIAILNDDSKKLIYYVFDEQAHNTFDEQSANKVNDTIAPIRKRIPVQPQRLCKVLDENIRDEQQIDFLSIDVEGMDLEVLKSNDWRKYRPNYIVAESRSSKLKMDLDSELSKFMEKQNYELIAKTHNSLFFKVI